MMMPRPLSPSNCAFLGVHLQGEALRRAALGMMGVFLTVIVTVPAKPEVPGLVSLRQERPCRLCDGIGDEG